MSTVSRASLPFGTEGLSEGVLMLSCAGIGKRQIFGQILDSFFVSLLINDDMRQSSIFAIFYGDTRNMFDKLFAALGFLDTFATPASPAWNGLVNILRCICFNLALLLRLEFLFIIRS